MGHERYGRYEALHRIASGGMASVYLGRTRGPGGFERLVALKVMHDHIRHDPAFSAMFLDEARLAARIRHPNVVPTLDVAEDGRYIVMEYVEGASLHAILSRLRKRGETIPLPIALRIFVDALSGLHAAHELADAAGKPLNIVHRDVSPHNILVGVDGTSRITDFGIAHAEARITSTRGGEIKGKLPYMAPEQLQDEDLDRRTDVYAAGCVLWEVLVGERLFRGGSEAAVACAILAGAERSPRQAGADVPASLDAACMQALGSRQSRFLTALAFSEAVERAADVSGIKIARHRDVGRFAQKTAAVTFPAPTSIMSGRSSSAQLAPDEEDADRPRDPMPSTVPAKPEDADVDPPPTAPTVTRTPSTTDGSPAVSGRPGPDDHDVTTGRATLPSLDDAEAAGDTSVDLVAAASLVQPEGARATARDEPASAHEGHDGDAEDAPNTAVLLAASLGRPRTKATSWLAVAIAAATAIAVGVWFVASTGGREPSDVEPAASGGARPTAEASVATSAASPEPGGEGSDDLGHADDSASPRASTSATVSESAPPRPAALRSPPPVRIRPRSDGKTPPAPASTGYHPATP